MYRFIKGIIDEIGKDFIVVDNNGIGYKIYTSTNSILNIQDKPKQVKIYTHFHVREDDISIYGFYTKEELEIYELLLSVSKIGPKVGLGIISTIKPQQIKLAIATEDIVQLSKAPGVGKKTAKRIILELKDKIDDNISIESNDLEGQTDNNLNEVIGALLSLGYSKVEATRALSKVEIENQSTEDVIKAVLKQLSK